MNQDVVARRGVLEVNHGRRRVDVDLDELGCVLGERPRLRDDDGDRVAHEPDVAVGERPFGWRDHVEQRCGGHASPEPAVEIGGGEHGDDTGRRLGRRGVETDDSPPRHLAPHEVRAQRSRHPDIVDVAAPAGQQARVLPTADHSADQARRWRQCRCPGQAFDGRRHQCLPAFACAAWRTALMIPW